MRWGTAILGLVSHLRRRAAAASPMAREYRPRRKRPRNRSTPLASGAKLPLRLSRAWMIGIRVDRHPGAASSGSIHSVLVSRGSEEKFRALIERLPAEAEIARVPDRVFG